MRTKEDWDSSLNICFGASAIISTFLFHSLVTPLTLASHK